MTAALEPTERAKLRQLLESRFDLSELRNLAFDLGSDYRLFSHETTRELSRELVAYFERKGRLNYLVAETLKQRHSSELVDLLARLPPCLPSKKLQIVVTSDLLESVDMSALVEGLAAKFNVSENEIALIGAVWGSMRLLVSLPRDTIDEPAVSKIRSLGDGECQIVSVAVFDSLDSASQKAWRLVAHRWLPVRQGGVLQPSVSWQEALEARRETATLHSTLSEWLSHDLIAQSQKLSQDDRDKLVRVARGMSLVADIGRSDVMLYVRNNEHAVVVAQARPHSIMSVYADNLVGRRISSQENAAVFRVLRLGYRVRGSRRSFAGGAPVIQEVWPVRGTEGRVIAALSVEANLIAYVRQKSRSRVFQGAVRALQKMLLVGELAGAETLSPFGQHDGILVVDDHSITRYASGIATEHYRKLGYLDNLVDRHLSTLNTGDHDMFRLVFQELVCHEAEYEERTHLPGADKRIWIRKAVPLVAHPVGKPWWQPWKWFQRRPVGILFAIHDATEERRKERELKIQSAMIQEIHHRVKNNLQTVAAVLRMQVRRSDSAKVRRILKDSVGRILSMSVVHEYLSREEGQAINIREVTQRIIQQMKQGVLSPDKQIRIVFGKGSNLYLPARQATACALVINELLQNAIEHGYETRNVGTISVKLIDEGDMVCIIIADDGAGLPPGFDLGDTSSLGLQIVRTLVQDDLRGTIEMRSDGGVHANIRFSKQILEGEGHWNVQG